MKTSSRARLAPWLLGGGLALAAASSSAQVANGDFESGLAGWATIGDASLVAAPAPFGSQLWLTTASVLDQDDSPLAAGALNRSGTAAVDLFSSNALTAFFGLSPTGLDPDPAAGIQAIEGSAARQSFSASAGDVLSFRWNFGTSEQGDLAQGDYGFLVIDGEIKVLARPSDATLAGSFGNALQTGYASYSVTLGTTGTHTLSFGVVDVGDISVTSTLAIDGVTITAVPEPASWATMLAGLVALSAFGRARSRRS